MTPIKTIKTKNYFYKMGVMCGDVLYCTYKFDDFEKMIEEADRINDKYKSDMRYCTFVIQAFKDSSYDFNNSCFFQEEIRVNSVNSESENIAKRILQEGCEG